MVFFIVFWGITESHRGPQGPPEAHRGPQETSKRPNEASRIGAPLSPHDNPTNPPELTPNHSRPIPSLVPHGLSNRMCLKHVMFTKHCKMQLILLVFHPKLEPQTTQDWAKTVPRRSQKVFPKQRVRLGALSLKLAWSHGRPLASRKGPGQNTERSRCRFAMFNTKQHECFFFLSENVLLFTCIQKKRLLENIGKPSSCSWPVWGLVP